MRLIGSLLLGTLDGLGSCDARRIICTSAVCTEYDGPLSDNSAIFGILGLLRGVVIAEYSSTIDIDGEMLIRW